MSMNGVRVLNEELMEQICERVNLNQAYKKVKANKVAPGVDKVTIDGVYSILVITRRI